jgi:hypothetical protein
MAEGMKEPMAAEPPVIGYSTDGKLIRGTHRGKGGAWLVPFPPDERVIVRTANALDRKILGVAADEPVAVLLKSCGEAWRYLARNISFLSVTRETAEDDESLEKLMREWAGRESRENEQE